MRCLVTGGCGFLGWHLSNRLADLGHEVIIFDLPGCERKERYGITILPRDVCNPYIDNPNKCIQFPNMDVVFHLAAMADIIPSIEKPSLYHYCNVTGTVNMLKFALEWGVKKFVYASSTSIYGIPCEYPTSENAKIDPQYPYALTKWIAEEYVRHWSKVY
jgi:UDP-glucose 4-epimerase